MREAFKITAGLRFGRLVVFLKTGRNENLMIKTSISSGFANAIAEKLVLFVQVI